MGLQVEQHPCWTVVCDGCGEGDNEEYGGVYHHPTAQAAEQTVKDADWTVFGTVALCLDCRDSCPSRVACPRCEVPIGVSCPDPDSGPGNPCEARALALMALLANGTSRSHRDA